MDVLNIIALFTTSQKNAFLNLTPENLIISKDNGKFSRDFTISKDSRCGFYLLNNE